MPALVILISTLPISISVYVTMVSMVLIVNTIHDLAHLINVGITVNTVFFCIQ